ncbi:hypothetical protein RF11_16000 [Thelohanellus kitauei]|uniref:Uncharacterized protein n=1 Tax=Thelohanellus kitauei TaxID=669202 RepID=A0A0C2MHC6_THEKT|nr:hypothetical protein RF11_16000 [Thelohanellus kitauei]
MWQFPKDVLSGSNKQSVEILGQFVMKQTNPQKSSIKKKLVEWYDTISFSLNQKKAFGQCKCFSIRLTEVWEPRCNATVRLTRINSTEQIFQYLAKPRNLYTRYQRAVVHKTIINEDKSIVVSSGQGKGEEMHKYITDCKKTKVRTQANGHDGKRDKWMNPQRRTVSTCNAQAICPVSFLQAGKAPDLPIKIGLINEPDKTGVPDIKLIRTDTTLDLSQ